MADLNRFYRALLTGRLLHPDLLAQMQTTAPFDPSNPEVAGYGLGIYWFAVPCGRAWGHNGGVIGYTTDTFHSTDARHHVSSAQNASHTPAGPGRRPVRSVSTCAACPAAGGTGR